MVSRASCKAFLSSVLLPTKRNISCDKKTQSSLSYQSILPFSLFQLILLRRYYSRSSILKAPLHVFGEVFFPFMMQRSLMPKELWKKRWKEEIFWPRYELFSLFFLWFPKAKSHFMSTFSFTIISLFWSRLLQGWTIERKKTWWLFNHISNFGVIKKYLPSPI